MLFLLQVDESENEKEQAEAAEAIKENKKPEAVPIKARGFLDDDDDSDDDMDEKVRLADSQSTI